MNSIIKYVLQRVPKVLIKMLARTNYESVEHIVRRIIRDTVLTSLNLGSGRVMRVALDKCEVTQIDRNVVVKIPAEQRENSTINSALQVDYNSRNIGQGVNVIPTTRTRTLSPLINDGILPVTTYTNLEVIDFDSIVIFDIMESSLMHGAMIEFSVGFDDEFSGITSHYYEMLGELAIKGVELSLYNIVLEVAERLSHEPYLSDIYLMKIQEMSTAATEYNELLNDIMKIPQMCSHLETSRIIRTSV